MCRKCGNMGHVERICKSKSEEAKVVVEEREDNSLSQHALPQAIVPVIHG